MQAWWWLQHDSKTIKTQIIFFSTIMLSLYVQKHDIWTVIEESDSRRKGDDLPPPH